MIRALSPTDATMFLQRLFCLALLATVAGCASPPPARTAKVAGGAPLLLVSIDGFRADYLGRGISPTLAMLAQQGVRARGMQPSFPSLTFPNHYTLVTGDYPDRHGIVDNSMRDPSLGRFTLGDRGAVGDGRWWDGAEPIWVTAQRQGIRAATMFWPGSEASIRGVRPDHWLPYDGAMSYDARVDQVLQWLDLPPAQRPGFITLYFEAVDTAGHEYGPDAAQTNEAIARVDAALARLVAGLRRRGLFDHVNLIVLADHGMASTPPGQRIFLDDLVAPGDADLVASGAVAGIAPVPGHEAEVAAALLKPQAHMHCWRKARIPARLHYGSNPRIPPLVCLADVGWLITHNRGTALHHGRPLYGEHGFDNVDPRMQALFVAHGPGFRRHAVVPSFPNIDVYPLMAHLLGIRPQPDDGDYDAVKGMLSRQ